MPSRALRAGAGAPFDRTAAAITGSEQPASRAACESERVPLRYRVSAVLKELGCIEAWSNVAAERG